VSDRDPLVPTAGARFLLELDGAPGAGPRATYRAAVITPDARFDYDAQLADDGGVTLAARGTPATPEHEDMLAMIAKLVARGAPGRRDDGLPVWPARVTRWRGPGRGG
jgi:hypothetical protein